MGFIELGQILPIFSIHVFVYFFTIKCLGSGQNVDTNKVGKPETHIFYLV